MKESVYLPDTERFMKEHPEIEPAAQDLVGAAVTNSEEAVFNFVMSYIFM